MVRDRIFSGAVSVSPSAQYAPVEELLVAHRQLGKNSSHWTAWRKMAGFFVGSLDTRAGTQVLDIKLEYGPTCRNAKLGSCCALTERVVKVGNPLGAGCLCILGTGSANGIISDQN